MADLPGRIEMPAFVRIDGREVEIGTVVVEVQCSSIEITESGRVVAYVRTER